MARYLTPAKVGLLALIELYTDSVVAPASAITILSFIVSHLLPSSLSKSQIDGSFSANNDVAHNFIISIKDFESLLNSHYPASGLPGRTLWDLFLKKLWEIDSLDGLHIFFERKVHLLTKTREDDQTNIGLDLTTFPKPVIPLSKTSPFGIFVRRAHLEFTRLKFHDVLNLWKNFIAYRQPTFSTWRKRNPTAGAWSFDVVLEEGSELWENDALENFTHIVYGNRYSSNDSWESKVSTDDVEKLLEFQVEQMQKLGARLSQSIQDQFRDVLNSNIIIPSLSHYVNFLDAWRAGDYPTAFNNLHRFFDYTMQSRDRIFYQYALLNLAVLQADFGCYEEAVATMEETVSTARENKDMGCLNFSLSWLYHFGKSHPNIIEEADRSNMLGVEREGLAFLRAKAKESGMWSLWSSSLLSEAKMGLSSGESVATSFENILRSSQLNVTKNNMNTIGVQSMLQSSIWSRLGITYLAWSYCEVFLRCYYGNAPYDDVLKFTCRAAYLLTQKGLYDAAEEKLEGLDNNFFRSLKTNQYWLMFHGIVQLKRDLHKDNLDGVDRLLAQLLQCRSNDPDFSSEVNTLHIDSLIRRGDYNQALKRIEELSLQLRDDGEDIFFRVTLLSTKAKLLDKCGRPERGFSVAVRAATIAWRARLLPSLWHAMGITANILTNIGEFEASMQVLVALLPRALECDDCSLSAQLFSYLVDAHMGMAGQPAPDSLKRTEHLTKALGFIDRAFAEYSALEDVRGQCEMMAKKATIMQLVGDQVLANDYAGAYLAIRKEALQSQV